VGGSRYVRGQAAAHEVRRHEQEIEVAVDGKDVKDMDECRICGAVIVKRAKHREWHEAHGDVEPRTAGTGKIW
jgi:hypothetical protein